MRKLGWVLNYVPDVYFADALTTWLNLHPFLACMTRLWGYYSLLGYVLVSLNALWQFNKDQLLKCLALFSERASATADHDATTYLSKYCINLMGATIWLNWMSEYVRTLLVFNCGTCKCSIVTITADCLETGLIVA